MNILESEKDLLGLNSRIEKVRIYFKDNFEDAEHQFFVFASLIKGSTLMYCVDKKIINNKMLDYICEEIINRFAK